jgi:heme exporter protein B
MKTLGVILAILWKDLLAERRTREILSATIVFALVVILIFVFAFDLSAEARQAAAPGVIWATLCFSGTLSLNRTMSAEKDLGGMDGLLLAPVDRVTIFIGKLLVNWIYMILTAAVIIPVYSLFNNVNLFSLALFGVILLGTLGYVTVGTLLTGLALQTRSRETLLPVLLFPVLIPLLLSAVHATSLILQGNSPPDLSTWIMLLVSFDLIFLAAGVLLFDSIIEE